MLHAVSGHIGRDVVGGRVGRPSLRRHMGATRYTLSVGCS